MNKSTNKIWVTERDAAGILQLPGSFLRRSVEKGALKAVVKFLRRGYKYLYNKVDLENYIYENPELIGL